MLTKEENEFLTRVGPGTPAGEMLRRYWHPIAFSNELKRKPLRRRILGEDLVLFRDEEERLGLLALRCSHRGTSLEFGHLEDGGLRCCYHGWLYDVEGRVLEMPGEPEDSTFRQRVCHPAYTNSEYLPQRRQGRKDLRMRITINNFFKIIYLFLPRTWCALRLSGSQVP